MAVQASRTGPDVPYALREESIKRLCLPCARRGRAALAVLPHLFD
jgi:hypothetical protein